MDQISYAHSAKQSKRIKRFIADPDSSSGLVSVPKKIALGQSVTIPDGRVVVHPNLEIDGTLTIEDGGELFVPFGGALVSSDLMHPVDTIDDLRNETGKYKYVYVTGYHTKDDGAFGSNMFVWDENSTETDNGGTVIECTTVTTGRYKLKYSGAINVKWFGAKGDGVTSNQTSIERVVAYAYANKVELYWPEGEYISTRNISNFHEVRHTGQGCIKRNDVINYISPIMTQIKTAYCSPSGTLQNDGLSPDVPTTLSKALDRLVEEGSSIKGVRVINLSAGTHTAPTKIHTLPQTTDSILITGPTVSNGVPTAIIDANGGEYCFYFTGWAKIHVRDVKGINATGNSVASAFITDAGMWFYAENVHTKNTQWAGINSNNARRLVVHGGVFEDSVNYGVRSYRTGLFNFGSDGRRSLFKNCGAGVISQGSYGHTDNCDFEDCPQGILAVYSAHTTSYFNTFTRVNRAHLSDANSTISRKDNTGTGTSVDYGRNGGTFTEDDKPFRFAQQFHPVGGNVAGRFSWGYDTLTVPHAVHQFCGHTKAPFNMSSFGPCTTLIESGANTIYGLASPSTYYSAIWFGDEISARRLELRSESSGGLSILMDTAHKYSFRPQDFIPRSDNTQNLGSPSYRWAAIFAGTGTINTSDAREKTFSSIPEVEKQVATELKGLMRRFKFNDAIEAKGIDNARIHYGTSAQEVIETFKKHGLDAFDYAMVCYDEWEEQEEETDEEGTITQEYRPAGNRYGIRYEELLCFIISAM